MLDFIELAQVLTFLSSGTAQLSALAITSIVVAASAVWWATRNTNPITPSQRALVQEAQEKCVFFFDDIRLWDATPRARQLLNEAQLSGSEWTKVLMILVPRFPGLAEQVSMLEDTEEVTLFAQSPTDDGVLNISLWEGLLRLEVKDLSEHEIEPPDALRLNLLSQELTTLRQATRNAPFLIWSEDQKGAIRWANAPYLDLLEEEETAAEVWPPAKLFSFPRLAPEADHKTLRLQATTNEAWYDVTAVRRGSEIYYFAVSAAQIVKAENELRSFVQTLSKAFAQLPVGLAVFDRNRQMVLFNPALLDLTTLAPAYLAARPTLVGFLDKLREARMIPEPKSYREWRQSIVELEHKALTGAYQETWHLPSGATYRISGHPHPDGAIALFFENISQSASIERQHHMDVALGKSVLEALPEALAVFTDQGALRMSNSRYRQLFGIASEGEEISLKRSLRRWQDSTLPTPVWADLRDYIQSPDERSEWTARVVMPDSRAMNCRFSPLPGGATLTSFSYEPFALPPLKLLKEQRRA